MVKKMALVINCGSSSLKYGVFDAKADGTLEEVCAGLVDKIGMSGCVISHEFQNKKTKTEGFLKDHSEAMEAMVKILTEPGGAVANKEDIKVVGHRVVHGGPKISQPIIIDAAGESIIEENILLAPLHNPANLLGIRMAKMHFKVKHVGVFDTAFHATMPPESYRYALPKELYEQHAVRRYGFHGTSYKYVTGAAADMLSLPLSQLNMIVCHLGNGCSMACIQKGQVVDTTMGLTPLEGLMMGTRSGDVDLGVYTFLCEHLKMTPKEVDTMLNKKSGLLGVAGKSDMREVIQAAEEGDEDSKVARAMYVQRVRKYIGAFLVKLNGHVDALVFTAGVGENDKAFRELATEGLESLGMEVDAVKNRAMKGGGVISTEKSITKVLVVPTQEELCIAQQSLELCGLTKPQVVPRAGQANFKPPKRSMTLTVDEGTVFSPKMRSMTPILGGLAITSLAITAMKMLRS